MLPTLAAPLPMADAPRQFRRTVERDPAPPVPYLPARLSPTSVVDQDNGGQVERLLLIAAPGAVGKTSLAHYLANETGNPLWLLERLTIGDGTLLAILGTVYGLDGQARVLELLRDGDVCIILDSLDEALIGPNSFGALTSLAGDLEEIVSHAPAGNPVVVVLGRVESISNLHAELDFNNVRHTFLELEYFDFDAAAGFVSAKLESARRLDHDYSGPLDDEDERINGTLESFLNLVHPTAEADLPSNWENLTVRSFLGYAPVLSSLADLLHEGETLSGSSPFGEATVAATDGEGDATLLVDHWEPILRLCQALCQREQPKLEDRLANEIELGGAAYDPLTQVELLLDYVAGAGMTRTPEWLKVEDQAIYREAVAQQRESHPFLNPFRPAEPSSPREFFSNSVFYEYALATAATQLSNGQFEQLHDQLAKFGPLALGPVFGRLVLRLSQEPGRAIPLAATGLLIRSLGESRSNAIHPVIEIGELEVPPGAARALSIRVADDAAVSGSVEIGDAVSPEISLGGTFGDIFLDVPWLNVRLGGKGGWHSFVAAGDVFVRCADLRFASPDLVITESGTLHLEVHGAVEADHFEPPEMRSDEQLRFYWGDGTAPAADSLPWPWATLLNGPVPEAGSSAIAAAAAELRQLFSAIFHNVTSARRGGGIKAWQGGLESTISGGGNRLRRMYDFATDEGLIRTTDGLCRIELTQFGLDLAAIRSEDTRDSSLYDFLDRYMRS